MRNFWWPWSDTSAAKCSTRLSQIVIANMIWLVRSFFMLYTPYFGKLSIFFWMILGNFEKVEIGFFYNCKRTRYYFQRKRQNMTLVQRYSANVVHSVQEFGLHTHARRPMNFEFCLKLMAIYFILFYFAQSLMCQYNSYVLHSRNSNQLRTVHTLCKPFFICLCNCTYNA